MFNYEYIAASELFINYMCMPASAYLKDYHQLLSYCFEARLPMSPTTQRHWISNKNELPIFKIKLNGCSHSGIRNEES